MVPCPIEQGRAFGTSAVAAAEAEKMILAEDCFTPEVGRARACGAKDAADSLQKVTRAARLTMKLQMAVAETVRDLRAGIVPARRDETASSSNPPTRRIVFGDLPEATAQRADADDEGRPACEERLFGDRERAEFDRPESLPRGAYPALVDRLAADVGAVVDWDTVTVKAVNREPRDTVLAMDVVGGDPRRHPPGSHPSAKLEAALSP